MSNINRPYGFFDMAFSISDNNVSSFLRSSNGSDGNNLALVKTCNNIFVVSEKVKVRTGGASGYFLVPVLTIVDKFSFKLINYAIIKNEITIHASAFTYSPFSWKHLSYINNSNISEEIKYNIFIKRYNILNKRKFNTLFDFMNAFTDCIDNDV